MSRPILALLALSMPLLGQTQVYLRASGPAGTYIVAPGCTATTPPTCTTGAPHNLNVGDIIYIDGLATTDSHGACITDTAPPYNVSNIRGWRKVQSVPDATHFSVTDVYGNDIVPNGPWCDGSVPANPYHDYVIGGPQTAGKVQAFNLIASPRVWFDGPTGTLTRQWALGTANGLTSLAVDGGIATVTTSYPHNVQPGQSITVWDTANATLNNGDAFTADYTVSGATTYTFTFAVDPSIPAGDYTSNPHCGPGASPDGTIQGTDNCVRVSQLAVQANPAWLHVYNGIGWDNSYKSWYDGGFYGGGLGDPGFIPRDVWAGCALRTMVNPASQDCVDVLVYALNHVERLSGVNFMILEPFLLSPVATYGGTSELNDYASYVWMHMARIYEEGSPYLTQAQKQTYLDKMYNDVTDPNPCNKVFPRNNTLAAGISQDGNSSHITLAAAETAADGYYVNNVVVWQVPNGLCGNALCVNAALITAYDSATRQATLTRSYGVDPAGPNESYSIFATVSASTATVTAGITQGGSATTIILAAADSRPDGYYVNDRIYLPNSSQTGIVTAYDGAGNTATVLGWSLSGPPLSGSPYTIYRDTITGYNTSFTADLAAGYMVYGENSWAGQPSRDGTFVNAVLSDTSLVGINGASLRASATPQILWMVRPWQSGDCGLKNVQGHWGTIGAQPIVYPVKGGGGYLGPQPGVSGNNGATAFHGFMLHSLAAADDDVRARWMLTSAQAGWFDYGLREYLNHMTGFTLSGSHYQMTRTTYDEPATMWAIANAVVGYPSMDTAGPVMTAISLYKVFNQSPDSPAGSDGVRRRYPMFWGQAAQDNWYPDGQAGQNFYMDYGMVFNPTAPSSGYLRDFMNKYPTHDYLWVEPAALSRLHLVQPLDYTTQPHQYYFGATSQATCAALTGWTCPADERGDAVISRSGWTSLSDSVLFFQSRLYWSDHDIPEPGTLHLYAAGNLLGSDAMPSGAGDDSNGALISTVHDDAIGLTNSGGFNGGETYDSAAVARIFRWASASRGSWDPHYGDQNSNYIYAAADMTGAYRTTYNRVHRHVAEFKKPGTEHIIVTFTDVDASNSPTPIWDPLFYPQNGETLASAGSYVMYNEGATTCPGTGGCADLNANRQILEQEDGAASPGDPPRTFNLISRFLSPAGAAPVFIRWDGDKWGGSNGHANRVSVCADPSSTGACGATASGLEFVQIHKLAVQPDTTLTAAALNPDTNWTGVQTSDKVVLFARGGATHSSINPFTTTHAGSAQYLLAGMAEGTYRVTVGGSPVNGSPFTVTGDDTTIYFESTAGLVSVTRTAPGIRPRAADPVPLDHAR